MEYLIGLDIGTSSVKGVLMTTKGEVIKTAHGSFDYTKTDKGEVYIEADKFIDVCFGAIKELAQGEIKGICASSASGNMLLLDKDDKPITPIYNWQNRRVTTEPDEILKDIDREELYKKIGWPFSGKAFPLAELCYIKKHNPELLEKCKTVCMSTEYLYYKLTGKWGISSSAGTTFYLIDQEKGTYITELLDIFGIKENQLPPVMPCGSKLGGVTKEASEQCGLLEDTPVVLGSFDHPSAARGTGVSKEGEVLLSCGTSWVGFFPVNDRNKLAQAKVLIDPFLSENGGPWAGMVSVASLSERIRQYTHHFIDSSEKCYDILAELAKKSVLGANGLSICLLDQPDDEKVKGYSKEDVARAIMEGAVNLLKDKLEVLKTMGITPKTAFMVGGPSECPLYSQLIEQICGMSVRVLHGSNAGAVGAAKLAGKGIGMYKNLSI